MAKTTNKQRLINDLIQLLAPMSDVNINDMNAAQREAYEPSTDESFNKDLKRVLIYNFINPITKPWKNGKGSTLDQAKAWADTTAATAADVVSQYHNPGDADARPTDTAVARACRTADQAKAKYEALIQWAEVCQQVFFEFNGYYFEASQEEKQENINIDDYLNRYGTNG